MTIYWGNDFCSACHTIPCVCRQPGDTVHRHIHEYGSYHFTPNAPTAEEIREIIREELKRAGVGKEPPR
jgi:hypothetical protein